MIDPMRDMLRRLKQRLVPRPEEPPPRPEIALISFPKCGRTWVRMLLSRAVANHLGIPRDQSVALAFSFAKLADLCAELPLIRPRHDDVPHWRRPRELNPTKEEFADQGVIFLVRDPRDVIVSLYFELSKRLPKYIDDERAMVPEGIRQRVQPFTGSISDFVKQDVGGFETIVSYYNIWAANRRVPQAFMLLRYEDLYNNTREEAYRLLNFIGMNHIADEHVEEAIEFSKFENMRNMETSGKVQDNALKTDSRWDTDAFKTRRGVIGGFREYLQPADVELISQYMVHNLSPYFRYKVAADADSGREQRL